MTDHNQPTTIATEHITLSTGEQLAYYDSAPGTSSEVTAIVLLHGYCGSSAYFSELVPMLNEQYRILVPDLLGHGASTASDKDVYGMELAASWIHEWMTQLGVENVHLFGHSLGGYVALALAETSPSYLNSFGLIHSTALPDSDQAKDNRDTAIQTVQELGVDSFVAGLVTKLFAHSGREQQLLDYATAIGTGADAHAVIGFAKGMKERVNRAHVINKAIIPVLLVSGGQDRIVQAEATFTGRNENTQCHIINEAGHMGMLEAPEQLATIIKQFVK